MNKKVLYWVIGVVGAGVIGMGIYAYSVYSNVSNTANNIYKPLERDHSDKRDGGVDVEDVKPVSILVIGADERGEEQGRSDTLIVMTLNPAQESMKMVSIPRDTYTEIVGRGTKDKINHAYAFGGVDMTVATVENFLDVPVDYYVEMNMAGFKDIVDAVGGVDVENDISFSYGGYDFPKGQLHLNGTEALIYSRVRKQDPRGDFGRQMRQRQVIQAIIKKGADVSTLAKYDSVLRAIKANMRTNLSQSDMISLQQNYKNSRRNVEEIQIPGEGGKASNGIWYYMVSEQTKQELSNKLREHLEMK